MLFVPAAVGRLTLSLWMLRLSISTLERATIVFEMRVELRSVGRFGLALRVETDLTFPRTYIAINRALISKSITALI